MSSGTRARACSAPLLAALALALACSSASERAADHLQKGRALAEQGRTADARLELQSALRYEPESVEANNELAALELSEGNMTAALVHINEAYRLDPSDSRAALNLASLLQADQPERAEALVEGVIHRDPENVLGYIGRSNLALSRGRMRAAGLAARKAMEVAPDDPRADWQLGYVMQAMIREGQLTGEPVEDSVYESALSAFERYIQKGGKEPWNAQIEEARIMAAWRGNNPQARKQFRIALDQAREKGSVRDQLHGAAHAIAFARSVRDRDLQEYALELAVEAEPRDYRSWRALADLRRRQREDPEDTWRQLLEQRPDDPRAHIEYARYLISQWKLDEALDYLSQRAAAGVDPPSLWSAIASTQLAANRMEAAQETVARLEQDHPEHPRTLLARAQIDLRRGRARKAVRELRALTAEHSDPDAWLLLARAERAAGDLDAALTAVEAAIDAQPVFGLEEHRFRAQLLADQGNCPAAIRSLDDIEERASLGVDDQLLLVRCRYENGQPRHARKLLEQLVAQRQAPAAAVLEYARREADEPDARATARRALDQLLRREPHNWQALIEATRLDMLDGLEQEALTRLDLTFKRSREPLPPQIRLLRAQVGAEAGRTEGVLVDTRAAFDAQPRLRGALELLVGLYLRQGEFEKALAAAEHARDVGAMDSERRLLLGRLYRMTGRDAQALATLEEALATDADNPSVYFHMGMALRALDRKEEATQALEKALAISTTFPEAEHAREALEGTRSAGAS